MQSVLIALTRQLAMSLESTPLIQYRVHQGWIKKFAEQITTADSSLYVNLGLRQRRNIQTLLQVKENKTL